MERLLSNASSRVSSWTSRNEVLIVWPILVVLFFSGWYALQTSSETRGREKIFNLTSAAADRVVTGMEAELAFARATTSAIVASIEADPDFSESHFEQVVSKLSASEPSIVNFALAPGLVVDSVFPSGPNESVLGHDLSKVHGDAIQRAIDGRELVIEGPLKAIQGFEAFIVRAPAFISTEDQDVLWGIVSVVLEADVVFAGAGIDDIVDRYSVGLRALGRGENDIVFATPEAFGPNDVRRTLRLPGENWELSIRPTKAWAAVITQEGKTMIIGYIVACIIVSGLLLALQLHRKRLEEARNILRDAVEILDNGFVIFDEDDRFVLCNDAYRELYHKSDDLFVPGTTFEKIIRAGVERGQYPQAVGREKEFIEERLGIHAEANHTAIQQLADGRWIRVEEKKTSRGYTVGLRVDVTELEDARADAEAAYKVKSEFISVLSHELRTPLTIILGYAKILGNMQMMKSYQCLRAHLLKEKADSEEALKLAEDLLAQVIFQARKMESSGSHLLLLINDLLDYSKFEAGHFTLHIEEMSLKSLICSVIEDMSESARVSGLSLVDESRNVTVKADKVRLKQVLINLLGNAIKFTDKGAITVTTRTRPGFVEVDVSDTGVGISEENLDAVFRAFQQVDFSDRRAVGGTGLGLAITRRIVEMHGGELSVKSTVGQGSTFTINLPLEAAELTREEKRRLSRNIMAA